MWKYAESSALYIFSGKSLDPLEKKILDRLKQGPISATELSRTFSGHVAKERLQPVLQQLEAQQRISISKEKNGGRPKLILTLREVRAIS